MTEDKPLRCDHDGCKNNADIYFYDGSKPTTLLLCNIHGFEHYQYYAKEGLLFEIKPIRSPKK
jgi:hypothetical protein